MILQGQPSKPKKISNNHYNRNNLYSSSNQIKGYNHFNSNSSLSCMHLPQLNRIKFSKDIQIRRFLINRCKLRKLVLYNRWTLINMSLCLQIRKNLIPILNPIQGKRMSKKTVIRIKTSLSNISKIIKSFSKTLITTTSKDRSNIKSTIAV